MAGLLWLWQQGAAGPPPTGTGSCGLIFFWSLSGTGGETPPPPIVTIDWLTYHRRRGRR